MSTGEGGGRRCLAGLIRLFKSSCVGRTAVVLGEGVMVSAGGECMCSTGSGIKGGRSE